METRPDTLYRLAGGGLIAAALVAGAAGAGRALLSEVGDPQGLIASGAAAVAFTANMVLILCLPAIALRQAGRAGVAGMIGYALFAIALLSMGVAQEMIFGLLFPSLPASMLAQPPTGITVVFLLTQLVAVVGLTLLGIATVRARVFPAWTGWALLASAVVLVLADVRPPLPAGTAVGITAEALHYLFFTAALIGMAVRVMGETAPPAGLRSQVAAMAGRG
jgi:hypothetical protein